MTSMEERAASWEERWTSARALRGTRVHALLPLGGEA